MSLMPPSEVTIYNLYSKFWSFSDTLWNTYFPRIHDLKSKTGIDS